MTPLGPNEYPDGGPAAGGPADGGSGQDDGRPCDDAREGSGELSCADVIRFLDDYVAGNLAPQQRAAFEAHLAICPQCVEYIASYRRTIDLVRDAVAPDAVAPPPASAP